MTITPELYIATFAALFAGMYAGWTIAKMKYTGIMLRKELDSRPKVQHYRTIDEAVHALNYRKIRLAMIALDWKYMDMKTGTLYTPGIHKLIDTATDVAECAVKYLEDHPGQRGYAGTGGFEAIAEDDENGKIWLNVKFVFEETHP